MTSSFDEARCVHIEENLKRIRENIANAALRAGRSPGEIRLMAVTKTVEPVYINYSIDHCGVTLIGENKVQEFLGKKPELHLENVETHIIGHLQTNKVKKILPEVDAIQSVDSVHLAKAISQLAVDSGRTANILFEVNIGSEQSKTGFPKEEFTASLSALSELPGLVVKGLMTIPPICEDEKVLRGYFESMRQLYEELRQKKLPHFSMEILSMGMSSDYETAICCGANLVRIGSAIYGKRNY